MIVGIDLGTTHSVAAFWRGGRVELVPNAFGEVLTPSVVSLDDNGEVLVGRAARERLVTHPQLSAAAFKRYMGTDRKLQLGGRAFRPEELSSFVLRALKADAEALLGEPVREAVVTVPAYFNDTQRKATRIAGELAGLDVRCLLNEPTAAALAYGLREHGSESRFLVFDLGGGTFDVSVLELFEGVVEVRASTGDNFLGGEDFDDLLVRRFWTEAGPKGSRGQAEPLERLDPRQLRRLRVEAERARKALSAGGEARMSLQWGDGELAWRLDRDTFAALVEPLLERLRAPLERALRDARIRASELDRVVLAGGATRMPVVRRLVAQLFGRFPDTHLDPDDVVARGAAIQAGLKADDAALAEMVMTDVCPYTLGIETAEPVGPRRLQQGIYSPIIERNTTIPTSRSMTVQTIHDYQSQVTVRVFQGESRWVKDNILLGRLEIPVPRKKAGEVALDVRFTYDANGLLECEVTLPDQPEARHRLVLRDNAGAMSDEEVEQRLRELAELKIHPRDRQVNRELLARAERMYEEALGDLREAIGQEIAAFADALDSQEPRRVDVARERLEKLLGGVLTNPFA
jgi:molecular chaperone HscC